jgi:hypothetical protein
MKVNDWNQKITRLPRCLTSWGPLGESVSRSLSNVADSSVIWNTSTEWSRRILGNGQSHTHPILRIELKFRPILSIRVFSVHTVNSIDNLKNLSWKVELQEHPRETWRKVKNDLKRYYCSGETWLMIAHQSRSGVCHSKNRRGIG